jgi:hypothetical protein
VVRSGYAASFLAAKDPLIAAVPRSHPKPQNRVLPSL